MMKWQPISEAPKDGTVILAFWKSGFLESFVFIQPMKWCDDREKFIISWDHDDECSPTHWMPMPLPPAPEAE